ncbi:MAG: translocation/assembly module TamB domain-containing protein [Planctomycetes bacterium]|nr:translocation/assembly module TamB domain-containing protein [Planctomycetota bacterium]
MPLRVLGALVALLLLAYLLRGPLLAGPLGGVVGRRLTTLFAGPVSVARLEGGWIADAAIVDIASGELTGPVVAVSCRRLAATYWLPTLLAGDRAGALTSLTAHGLHLTVDPWRTDPAEAASSVWPAVIAQLPDPLPALHVDGSFVLLTPLGPIEVRGFQLDALGTDARLVLEDVSVPGCPERMSAAFRVRRTAHDTLSIVGESPLAGVLANLVELRFGDDQQHVRVRLATSGGTVSADLTPKDRRVHADGVHLARVPSWATRAVPTRWLPSAGTVSGHARIAEGGWSAELIGDEVTLPGLPACDVTGMVTADAQGYHVGQVDVSSSGLRVVASGVEFDRHGIPSAGRVLAAGADAGTWLAAIAGIEPPNAPLAVALEADLDGRRCTATRLHLALAGATVDLVGDASWNDRPRMHLAGSIASPDLAALASALPGLPALAGASGACRLGLDGELPLVAAELARLDGTGHLDVTTSRLHIGSLPFGDIALIGDWRDGACTVNGDGSGVANWSVALSGQRAGQGWNGRIDRLDAETHGCALHLRAPATLAWSRDGAQIDACSADVAGGTIAFAGRIGQTIALSANLQNIDLGVLAAATGVEAEGRLDARLRMSGAAEAPDGVLTLTASGFSIADQRAHLDIDLTQGAQGMRLRRLVATGSGISLRGSGAWPVRIGRDGAQRVPNASGAITLSATMPDITRLLPTRGGLTGGSARVAVIARASPDGATSVQASSALRGLRLPFSDDDAVQRTVDGDMRVDADAQGLAITGDLRGRRPLMAVSARSGPLTVEDVADPRRLLLRPVSGTLSIPGLDLGLLKPWIPALVRLSGAAAGELSLDGTLADPHLHGVLALADLDAKPEGDVPGIADGTGVLAIHGRCITIERFAASMGFAPIAISGRVWQEGIQPLRLDVRLHGDNALLVQSQDLLLRADIQVAAAGPIDALKLSGRLAVTKAIWSRRIDLFTREGPGIGDDRFQLFSMRSGPLSTASFDLRVVADRSILLANNLVEATCSADLVLGGTGLVPRPTGDISTVDARVKLPFTSMRVARAELRFPEQDPFDPTISASGTARVNQYRLSIDVSGPLRAARIEVTSTPPLPPEEARLVLATGSTSAEFASEGSERNALAKVGTYLGLELLRRSRGPGDPEDDGVLDRFSLSVGEQSRSGQDTFESEFRLDEDGRLGWFLRGERDRYDAYNLGVLFRIAFR